jgi:hypothetical protein
MIERPMAPPSPIRVGRVRIFTALLAALPGDLAPAPAAFHGRVVGVTHGGTLTVPRDGPVQVVRL